MYTPCVVWNKKDIPQGCQKQALEKTWTESWTDRYYNPTSIRRGYKYDGEHPPVEVTQ